MKLSIPKFESVKEREVFLKTEMTDVLGDAIVSIMLHKGFCSAPASSHLEYHGCYEGGLFDHSLAVAMCLTKYTERLGLKWVNEDSPIRVGMLHDLCKIDSYKKNEKDDPQKPFVWNKAPIVKGHGDKSVIYALRYGCKLTEEEIACIIYHMGAYETDRWDDYGNAIEKYPNVLYTHMADMEASKIMGV